MDKELPLQAIPWTGMHWSWLMDKSYPLHTVQEVRASNIPNPGCTCVCVCPYPCALWSTHWWIPPWHRLSSLCVERNTQGLRIFHPSCSQCISQYCSCVRMLPGWNQLSWWYWHHCKGSDKLTGPAERVLHRQSWTRMRCSPWSRYISEVHKSVWQKGVDRRRNESCQSVSETRHHLTQ